MGYSEHRIEKMLTEQGIDSQVAHDVVDQMFQARKKAFREAALQQMLIGAAICIIGIAVTWFTYSAASQGGGRYVVAWGAVIFGAIRFFGGFILLIQS